MRSKSVPVLRLGSRGPGVQESTRGRCVCGRKRPQSFASVCGASDLRRTCRRDENRRETQNCRHFVRFAVQKCQQSQGSGGVLVAKRRIVVTFGLVSGLRVSNVSTVTGIGGGPRRETQNCRRFWTRLASSRLKSVNSHRDRGGSSSRNAELPSLLDSSCIFASQKCQQSQESGGVLVAKRRIVVTVGLASGERKGERREKKREMRGERREEKRRVDRRKERGDRREERRGEERRDEREKRREDRGGKRERRGERG